MENFQADETSKMFDGIDPEEKDSTDIYELSSSAIYFDNFNVVFESPRDWLDKYEIDSIPYLTDNEIIFLIKVLFENKGLTKNEIIEQLVQWDSDKVDSVLASLSPREEKVIRMRFGIGLRDNRP